MQCITEAERYSAKGFVAKPNKNKNAQKQEVWTECIEELGQRSYADKTVQGVLQRIAAQPNVPRKKPKFVNFLKSCMHFDGHRAEKVWQIIEEGLEEFKKRTAPPPKLETKPTEVAESTENDEQKTEPVAADENQNSEKSQNGTSEVTLAAVLSHALAQSTLDKSTKKILKKLQKRTDVPLKKKKFIKFAQKELELDTATSDTVWSSISEAIEALKTNNSNGHSTSQTNGSIENGGAIANGKKRKNSEPVDSESDGKKVKIENGTNGHTEPDVAVETDETAFDWQKSILSLFNKNQKDERLALDTLKSKVLKKYAKLSGDSEQANSTKITKKFNKQLKKVDSLAVVDNVVQLKGSVV